MPTSRQPYTECSIYYDGARGLEVGHYLATPAGSGYLVTSIRQNSKRPQRKHLKCLRWPKAEIPADSVVHPLYWYSRDKKPARRLSTVKA
jgi:hypothetical protein